MRNGSGTFNLLTNSWNPATNGTPATAADYQALINDVAAAITQSLSKDGQTAMTGNLPAGGNKITGLAAGTTAGDSVRYEQISASALATILATDPAAIRTAIAAAAAGSNADITALTGLTSSLLSIGTKQNTTSGTSIDFTGIPSWARRITLSLSGVSTSGTSNPLIQLGDSGGVETSGYLSIATILSAGPAITVTGYTAGFGINTNSAANNHSGQIVFTLVDPATNVWTASGNVSSTLGSVSVILSGNKALSATLDRVRITTAGGADTFDAGMANILYE